MTIKLADITPAPWNTRGEITPESVAELAASIKEQGLINPITLWRDKDEHVVCIAGNRRLAALKIAYAPGEWLNETDATEFSGTEDEARMVTVTENLQREDVSPIEEAKLVGACLDDGMSAEDIAAKTGRSTAWVNRRRRLLTLDESFAKVADKFTAAQLEKVASFPQTVQKNVAKSAGITTEMNWSSVKWMLERESHEIDTAGFCAKECATCANRTGAQADLWGDVDAGALGKCLDGACFTRKLNEMIAAKVKKLTKGAEEVVELQYVWQAPKDTTETRDAKHPCAYYVRYGANEIKVMWGASKAELDEEKKREDEERRAQNEELAKKRERENAISEQLEAWKDGDEDAGGDAATPARGLEDFVGGILEGIEDFNVREYIKAILMEDITGWHSNDSWADILSTFPKIAELAGVSEDDRAYFVNKFIVKNEEENN